MTRTLRPSSVAQRSAIVSPKNPEPTITGRDQACSAGEFSDDTTGQSTDGQAPTRFGAPTSRGSTERAEAATNVTLGRGPVADRDAQHGTPPPDRPAHPGLALLQQAATTSRVRSSSAEGDADLGEDHVVEHLGARDPSDPTRRTPPRGRPSAPPGRRHPPAQRREHRPHRDGPGPPGQLGHLLERVTGRVLDQVVAVHPHRRPHRGRVADDRQPAVVGHVEGLVRVGRPRVGTGEPAVRCRYAGEAAAKSPKAPSTCTQAPWRCAASIASANGS